MVLPFPTAAAARSSTAAIVEQAVLLANFTEIVFVPQICLPESSYFFQKIRIQRGPKLGITKPHLSTVRNAVSGFRHGLLFLCVQLLHPRYRCIGTFSGNLFVTSGNFFLRRSADRHDSSACDACAFLSRIFCVRLLAPPTMMIPFGSCSARRCPPAA